MALAARRARLMWPHDQRVQFVAVTPRQSELSTVAEDDHVVAVEKRLDFLDPVQIHDNRAADSEELRRREQSFHGADGFPHQVGPFPGMQPHVVAFGFNPVDFVRVNKDDPPLRAEGEPVGFWVSVLNS